MAAVFDSPLYSNDQSIDRVLNAGLPVLLALLDGTPPPAIDQALKRVASQEAGRLLVVQMSMNDSQQTAKRFKAGGAPALVTVKNGQVLSQANQFQAGDVERHASFLLGRGPKPAAQSAAEPAARPAGGAPSQTGAGQPVNVTDATFEQEVLRSPVPVVVDFWAPWCGPCRMVAPTLDKLAREWSGRVKIAKVNVDENPRVAGSYQVQSIPTMMVVKGGQVTDRWAGALPEPALRARLAAKI